ncbi:MAG: ATP/GTP-binding protein [Candidatus Heimdallarchaeum aukensis]|uniref:ATP/GTP-binding protein n=1 Tax=Candidatus Heimdallarchaeum aukensis TaxID=2876573 RepID=A0A9Y1BJH8_9ARCH|nr:MAG: ATP/GTP-binding protein [Candidatus Heimdallarchaeum aukensis]
MPDRKYIIYLLGTAGAGKTFLTRTLFDWFSEKKLDVGILNLDAGVRTIPYAPAIDVRDIVDINEIVNEYNLGPNGAMIASMDLIATKIHDLMSEVEYVDPQYLIVDTPGQIELFAYRSSGKFIANMLKENREPVSVFLIDPSLVLKPEGLASILLLSLSVEFQLELPQIPVISKADLIKKDHKERLERWIEEPETIGIEIERGQTISLSKQLGLNIIQTIEQFRNTGELFPISATTMHNIETLIAAIEREFGTRDDFYE